MEIQTSQPTSLSARRFVQWGLRGGALAALAPLLNGVFIAGGWVGDPLVALAAGVILGGLPALVMTVMRRRRDPLAAVERDLVRARAMVERRLIDEEDYQGLKRHALEVYRAGAGQTAPVWPLAFWGAVITTAFLSLAMISSAGSTILTETIGVTVIAALAGGSVAGGASQAYGALTGQGPRASLPGPTNRRLLDE